MTNHSYLFTNRSTISILSVPAIMSSQEVQPLCHL